jgi:hypothetical protein
MARGSAVRHDVPVHVRSSVILRRRTAGGRTAHDERLVVKHEGTLHQTQARKCEVAPC